jgi:hypothetical protein
MRRTYLDYTSTEIAELVDKAENGIYISKEKATELLKALKRIKGSTRSESYHEAFNKLRNALGGNDED